MTGTEAITALHALRAEGAVTSWTVHYVAREVVILALIAAPRYGRQTATARCVTFESAVVALLWRLDELEGQVAA